MCVLRSLLVERPYGSSTVNRHFSTSKCILCVCLLKRGLLPPRRTTCSSTLTAEAHLCSGTGMLCTLSPSTLCCPPLLAVHNIASLLAPSPSICCPPPLPPRHHSRAVPSHRVVKASTTDRNSVASYAFVRGGAVKVVLVNKSVSPVKVSCAAHPTHPNARHKRKIPWHSLTTPDVSACPGEC